MNRIIHKEGFALVINGIGGGCWERNNIGAADGAALSTDVVTYAGAVETGFDGKANIFGCCD